MRLNMAQWPFFASGFRAFFTVGPLLAMLAVALWVAALMGWLQIGAPRGGWLAWHRHELIFGFTGAIIAGFLLTAVANWTGMERLSGRPLACLIALWLLARVTWWLPAVWPFVMLNGVFFPMLALVLGRQLWAKRQRRNYPVVLVLLLLGAVELLVLAGVVRALEPWQRQGCLSAVWLIVSLMMLIGGRVIPLFTRNALGLSEGRAPRRWLDHCLLGGTLLVAALTVSGSLLTPDRMAGAAFVMLAVGHLTRQCRWFVPGVIGVPLVWSLHLAYLWLAVACALFAAWHFGAPLAVSQGMHALTVGAMGGLMLAMIARVSLGHTGRPMRPPRAFVIAFVLLNSAAVLRVAGVLVWYQASLVLAALAWSMAFAQFLFQYGPMLWKARVDGRPG